MPEPHYLLGKIRQLTGKFQTGDSKSPFAFYDLISFLLHQTVIKKSAILRLYPPKNSSGLFFIGGSPKLRSPLALNNGHYLRLTLSLFLEKGRLKVKKSSYQYQLDPEDTPRWIFRYDYDRFPSDIYPPSHLQINGVLREQGSVLRGLPDIHFPVNRIALEAIIRILIEQFEVKCNDPKHWHKVLEESERLFTERDRN